MKNYRLVEYSTGRFGLESKVGESWMNITTFTNKREAVKTFDTFVKDKVERAAKIAAEKALIEIEQKEESPTVIKGGEE